MYEEKIVSGFPRLSRSTAVFVMASKRRRVGFKLHAPDDDDSLS